MRDVQIYERTIKDNNGNPIGKVALLWGGSRSDTPTSHMNDASCLYVKNEPHTEYIDKRLNQPWLRVILKGLNEIPFRNYDIGGGDKVLLFEQPLTNKHNQEVGRLAIFIGGLNLSNPNGILNRAVSQYTQNMLYTELVDKNLDTPWIRMIITNIDQLPLIDLKKQHL